MDFVGKQKIWYTITLILLVICLGSFIFQGLNLGNDFTGGVLFQLKFADQNIGIEEVRGVLTQFGHGDSGIQIGGDNSITIRTDDMAQSQQEQVLDGFEQLGEYDLLRVEKVGPVFGAELRKAAILALVIASVLQIIYITFRFEFKFGITTIVTVLIDTILAIGLFSLLQLEVDGNFVAAVLTIVGYSINDKIVILDRIRENLRNSKKSDDFAELVNTSIRQSLTRSIYTGISVIFVLVTLLVWGGETTRNFSLAMLVGVISGCLTSIFIAGPLLVNLKVDKKTTGKLARAKS
ncbi:MAG: protein translocase subunit SecF [Peptococcia bacterium]